MIDVDEIFRRRQAALERVAIAARAVYENDDFGREPDDKGRVRDLELGEALRELRRLDDMLRDKQKKRTIPPQD